MGHAARSAGGSTIAQAEMMGHTFRVQMFVSGLAVVMLLPPAWATHSDVERHIDQVRRGLLPPVLVQGESPVRVSLIAQMSTLHVPGVSVAVVHRRSIEWARGFGVGAIDGRPVTPDTLFQAASISKVVTVLAVLRETEAGKLNLDEDVDHYLKTWKLPENRFTREHKVTLRELLSHSAGVTVHGFAGYPAGSPVPSLVQVLNGEPPANSAPIQVDSMPGSTTRYSGGGYVIAQQVLIDVTGTPFPRLMHDLVLSPLQMRDSTFDQPLPPSLLPRAAMPYRDDGIPIDGGPHVYPELAAAGLWTTPSDLARYAIGIQKALKSTSQTFLSSGLARTMLEPVQHQQALGLMVGGAASHRYFHFGGANEGYRCLLVAYEDGDGAVVMTNSDNGFDLAEQIIRTIAKDQGWPDWAPPTRVLSRHNPAVFDRYIGAYRSEFGDTITFWRNQNHVYARTWGQAPIELFPERSGAYFSRTQDVRWTYAVAPDGSVRGATQYEGPQIIHLEKLVGPAGSAALDNSLEAFRRFQSQTPAAASETALRRFISGIEQERPQYTEMEASFASVVREQLPTVHSSIGALGDIRDSKFKRVSEDGSDVYDVTFEHGSREFQILLGTDDLINSVQFMP